MNCEQLRALLDDYMDGALDGEKLREMEAHAATCEDCRRELEAARLVREAMNELPEEVPVPLKAQAGWRSAVRAEAKKRRNRIWLRAGYAVAAALVLALGATAVLRSMPARTDTAPVAAEVEVENAAVARIAVEPTSAVVARDGESETATQSEAYAARRKYLAEDVAAACASVEALSQEYSGSCTVEESSQGGAACRVELPREYLDDFLTAVSHVGEEQDSETMDTEGDVALVYIQIDEMK